MYVTKSNLANFESNLDSKIDEFRNVIYDKCNIATWLDFHLSL